MTEAAFPVQEKWIGVVLVGGKASRLGRDKALIRHGEAAGETWLSHTLHCLEPLVDALWLVGRASVPELPVSGLNLTVDCVADDFPDTGPLGGLVTAARASAGRNVLAVACDMPELTTEVLRALRVFPSREAGVAELGHGFEAAAYVDSAGRLYGLALGLRAPALAKLEDAYESGERRISGFLDRLSLRRLPVGAQESRALANINTPEELREYETTKGVPNGD